MYYMVKTELKKIVCRVETYICVALIVLCFFLGICDDLELFLKKDFMIPDFCFFYNSIFTGIVYTVLPILCVLPIVLSLWDENNSGYGNMVLIRTKKSSYITSKIISTIFSGIYIVILASVIFLLILKLFGVGNVTDAVNSIAGMSDTIYYDWAIDGKWFRGLILIVFCFALTTIPWTMIALVSAQFVKNKYLLVAIPLLINKIMIFICYAYEELFLFNPVTWNVSTSVMVTEKMGGLYYVVKVMIIIVIICSVLYNALFRRRLRNG